MGTCPVAGAQATHRLDGLLDVGVPLVPPQGDTCEWTDEEHTRHCQVGRDFLLGLRYLKIEDRGLLELDMKAHCRHPSFPQVCLLPTAKGTPHMHEALPPQVSAASILPQNTGQATADILPSWSQELLDCCWRWLRPEVPSSLRVGRCDTDRVRTPA